MVIVATSLVMVATTLVMVEKSVGKLVEKKCDGPTYLPTYGHLTWIGARDAKKGVICQNVCWFAPKIYTNQQKFWQVAL